MAPSVDRLKSKFDVLTKLDPFFTGGRIQISKDGKSLFCQCGDRVQVVDVASGKTIKTLAQEEDEVISFRLGPDDLTLISSHKSGLLRHWNVEDSSVIRTWKSLHLTPVVEIEFDTTTTLVATAGTDGSLKVWDIRKQYCTHNLKGGAGVYSIVKFHPDQKKLYLYGASMDGKIRCWDLKTSKMLAQMEGHYSVVTGMHFFPETNQAITSSRDKVLILWDLNIHSSVRVVPTFECVEAMIGVPYGSPYPSIKAVGGTHLYAVTAGERGCLRVWDMTSGREVYTQKDSLVKSAGEGALAITQLLFSEVDGFLYVVTYDHNIIVHQLSDFSLVKQYAGFNDDILDIVWYGEGETHLAVATNSMHVKVYDVETLNCTLLKGHTDLVLALAVSRATPDILVSSSKDNSIRVWKMVKSPFSITCIAQGNAHTGSVGSVALSRTRLSFIVSGSQDTCLKLWRISSTDDGDQENTLTVAYTAVAHDKDINAVCVSPNDKLIATGSQDKVAKIWDSSDLKLLGVMRGHRRGLWTVQFSPSDQILASGSADGTIKLWSLTDFSCLKTLEGHDSSVLRINFVAKGQQIVSAASDGLLKLWTIKTSECVATMDAHESKVWALAVKSDETMLASGAGDSSLILWKDVTREDRESAAQEKEKRIQEEQQLANLMKQGQLLDALALTIKLDQPFRSLNILKELMEQGENAVADLQKTILTFSTNQKDSLVRYSTTWNTNSRHCHQAQLVLNIIMANHTPDEIFTFPSLKGALAGLLVYNERHMQRLNRLRQGTAILPYIAAKIQTTRNGEVAENGS